MTAKLGEGEAVPQRIEVSMPQAADTFDAAGVRVVEDLEVSVVFGLIAVFDCEHVRMDVELCAGRSR